MPEKGVFSQIAIEALKRTGHEARMTVMPWNRALEMTKHGLFDGMLGASFTEERTRFFVYPKFFWPVEICFFAQADNPVAYTTPEALCPATIGLLRGSFHAKRFEGIPCLHLEFTAELKNNVMKLDLGRVDYILDSRDTVRYLLAGELKGLNNVKEVNPSYETDRVFAVFSRMNPECEELAADFDKGIALLKADGSYEAILKKHGVR